MSKSVESRVWERSRAVKTDLLMLIKIADLCPTDEGTDCWAEVAYLAAKCRMKERAAQYTLQRLERRGEIEIEHNDAGRSITLKGGRQFRPKWFIHVRCVSDWEAYQRGEKPASLAGLRTGRPKRKPAEVADFVLIETRKKRQSNPQPDVEKPAKTRHAYKDRSVNDPEVEQEQGQAGVSDPVFPDSELTLDDYLPIVTKVVHEVLDDYPAADDGDLTELVKTRIGTLNRGHNERSKIQYDGTLVAKAIDSARWQRKNARTA